MIEVPRHPLRTEGEKAGPINFRTNVSLLCKTSSLSAESVQGGQKCTIFRNIIYVSAELHSMFWEKNIVPQNARGPSHGVRHLFWASRGSWGGRVASKSHNFANFRPYLKDVSVSCCDLQEGRSSCHALGLAFDWGEAQLSRFS